jgi:hypothetical protein
MSPTDEVVGGIPDDLLVTYTDAMMGARDGSGISWWAAGACYNDGEGLGAGEAGIVLMSGGRALDFQYASVPAQNGGADWRTSTYAFGSFPNIPVASQDARYSLVNIGQMATGLGGLTTSVLGGEEHFDLE